MKYRRCKRCVMDNISDKSISFDKNGYCNYCNDIEQRIHSEYFPNDSKKLKFLIKKIKHDCKSDKYDCMVGVSGGIDSSYIIYLGYKYGLRMLAVHIDDGLDNPIAVNNLKKLTEKTNVDYVTVRPDKEEYADIIYSLLKASVSNLAISQDNLILKALQDYGEENKIKYSLDGANFAHESILERGNRPINPADKKFILSIQKRFGRIPISKLEFMSLTDRYIKRHRSFQHFRPLNYIDYNVDRAIKELKEFCGFEYYGGKHYESILTRFMQCYYLPEKFGIDKRKSHYSSLIMSGQMTREEAIKKLKEPLYPNEKMFYEDKKFLSNYMNITISEFERCISLPPKEMASYPHSILNEFAPLARKFRKILE